MNVYDFDGTIYDGDSTLDFYLFCLKKKPCLCLKWPFLGIRYLRFLINGDRDLFKGYFYGFLKSFHNTEELADNFWEDNIRKIKGFYLLQKRDDDLIISASPEFLLNPACARLGIQNLIASKVDIKTGSLSSANCRGEEKVRRINETFGNITIDSFYTDSISDLPLAKMARSAFMVKKNSISRLNITVGEK